MKQIILLTIFSVFIISKSYSQWCDMDNVEPPTPPPSVLKSGGTGCGTSINYAPYPISEHTPTKTLRVAIHVFQKGNGTGNFQDISTDRQTLNNLIDDVNYRLSHIEAPSHGTSPHIVDSKIQIVLEDIYFYQDDAIWNTISNDSTVTSTMAWSIYNDVILARTDLSFTEKYETLHIIMGQGDYVIHGGAASGIGDKEFIRLSGYYQSNVGPFDINRGGPHLTHELGHCLGLHHSWYSFVGCTDDGNAAEGTSNNYMDYSGSSRESFTECQLGRAHYFLMANSTSDDIFDCLIPDYCSYNSDNNISINSGQDILWNSSKYLKGNVIINNNGKLTINCAISLPKDAEIIIQSGGELILDHGDLDNACEQNKWKGITVENGGYLEVESSIISDYNIKVESGGTIRIISDLDITDNGMIEVESGGYICIDNPISLVLEDTLSTISLKPGYISGVNTSFVTNPGTCMSNASTVTFTGSGSISTSFSSNTYIQNENITTARIITGKNIYVGYSVTTSKPNGNVVIKNGANVIFDAEEKVYFEGGFNVELGGFYEVK